MSIVRFYWSCSLLVAPYRTVNSTSHLVQLSALSTSYREVFFSKTERKCLPRSMSIYYFFRSILHRKSQQRHSWIWILIAARGFLLASPLLSRRMGSHMTEGSAIYSTFDIGFHLDKFQAKQPPVSPPLLEEGYFPYTLPNPVPTSAFPCLP